MRILALAVLLTAQLCRTFAYTHPPSPLSRSHHAFRTRNMLRASISAASPIAAITRGNSPLSQGIPRLESTEPAPHARRKRVSSSLLRPAKDNRGEAKQRLSAALTAAGLSAKEVAELQTALLDEHDPQLPGDTPQLREQFMAGAAVGIDLGTTYSLVGYVKDGKPTLIPDEDGNVLLPSVVSYLRNGTALVGERARAEQLKNPQNTYASVKRVIGRTAMDARRADERLFDLNVVNEGGYCKVFSPALNQTLWPEEVSAEIAKVLIRRAEKHLGKPVTRAVVSAPAYFQSPQLEATKKAIMHAGVKRVQVIAEPTAAALAYGYDLKVPQLVLVVDLGGGTLDVAALQMGNGVIEILATSGDSRLGGKDFNQCVVDWLAKKVSTKRGVDPRRDAAQLRRLDGAAEVAKKMLSTHENVTISMRNIQPGVHLNTTLTRTKFVQLCDYPLTKMLAPIREVALMAGIDLPGDRGVRRQPQQNNTDTSESTKKLSKREMKVAEQKAEQEKTQRSKLVMSHVRALRRATGDRSIVAFPEGKPIDDVLLVGGASRMPCIANVIQTLTGVVPKNLINPDEAVALGATVQAGLHDGSIEGLHVMSPLESALLRSLNLKL